MHASLQFIAKCLIGMKRYIIQLYSFEFVPHVGLLEREREREREINDDSLWWLNLKDSLNYTFSFVTLYV